MLTEEQILALAPDESSKKSGKDLASLSKWVSKSANENVLWGECQGSGSKPYQTQIDLQNIAFKCSCPSRKFPCKHGLGLFLLFARDSSVFASVDMPAWVSEWINKRSEKKEKEAEKKEKPVDEAAQSKRKQVREAKVKEGIAELQVWIKDIVRNGLLGMPEKGAPWFENMARRMVDAQAPGLANQIRSLSEVNFYREDWQSSFMEQLVSLYLSSIGFNNVERLDPDSAQDIRSLIGFTQNQEELKEQVGITDTWLVLSKQVSETDNISTERYWLYGTNSGRYALVLQFIVRGQGATLSLSSGMFIQAELVYYPSASPLRAIIKRQLSSSVVNQFTCFENWLKVSEFETTLSSVLPVRGERAYLVSQLKPVLFQNSWWLIDKDKFIMPIRNHDRIIWNLLSLSGGEAYDMAVIGKENSFEPVGIWINQTYKSL